MINQKKILRICGLVIALSGVVILFSTIYPIVSYEWEASQKYPVLISPLVDEEKGTFTFSEVDYTKASNWFAGEEKQLNQTSASVSYFTLSVPRLGIDNASVKVGGEDLSENLIQYPGTALPGNDGNTVIFGHSILPQYYDPKNYLSIFSKLPTLEEGDNVYANYDGITYKYAVEDLFEVKPTDLQVLDQNSSGSYLTMITCTPPGHPLKPRRLIVRAKLIPAISGGGDLHAYENIGN